MMTLNEVKADILIIDDDPSIVVALNKTLNKLGRIRFAGEAKKGFAMIEQCCPDLILLDMELPGINGLELCSILKNDNRFKHIPVLFITSHIELFLEEAVFDTGAADYIVKPLRPRVVAARVQTHLNYQKALRSLENLVRTDSMTGLSNRRSFDEQIIKELRRARREQNSLTIALIDIDEFKKYNDYFGHLEGDTCIKQIAEVLNAGIRRPGDIAARYGGEEFAFILPNTDAKGAGILLANVLESVRKLKVKHAPNANEQIVTVSMGYSVVAPRREGCNDSDHRAVLQCADNALYQSKQSGRNQVNFSAL